MSYPTEAHKRRVQDIMRRLDDAVMELGCAHHASQQAQERMGKARDGYATALNEVRAALLDAEEVPE